MAVVLFLGGLGAPLVSTSRFTELEENSPVKSLCEELLLTQRINPQRQLRYEAGSKMLALSILQPRTLGHTQNCILVSFSGHRLHNGLLAPITC